MKSCHPLQWPVITMPIHRPLKQLNSKITHTYYPLRSSSAEKAGFSDPDSAWCQNANPIDAPLNLVLSQYTSAVRAGVLVFLRVCDKGPQGPCAAELPEARKVTGKRALRDVVRWRELYDLTAFKQAQTVFVC